MEFIIMNCLFPSFGIYSFSLVLKSLRFFFISSSRSSLYENTKNTIYFSDQFCYALAPCGQRWSQGSCESVDRPRSIRQRRGCCESREHKMNRRKGSDRREGGKEGGMKRMGGGGGRTDGRREGLIHEHSKDGNQEGACYRNNHE